ncbi:serine hydrolase [Streptomyces sp. NRRL F-2664]|uniref:serine hydrolase n=1 Tax=Streptomyces sp. NRRL F-2664 TaxID=1463842 RepID=UPI000998BD29|nr:serine hydrolase [Streptomyces sp. NRRL F-2664]
MSSPSCAMRAMAATSALSRAVSRGTSARSASAPRSVWRTTGSRGVVKRRAVRACCQDRSGLSAAPMPARTPAGNRARSTVVARMTPTSASGAAFTGRARHTRLPIRPSGSCERTATTWTGRSAANPRSRSARALAASSPSELMASSTSAGSAMVVRAGPYRVYDMSWTGTGAALVSTMEDLNRFYGKLLDGEIVNRSSLAQMQRTGPVIALDGSVIEYGLGLHKVVVPGCGTFWGHDGTVWGAGTVSLTRADGRRQLSVAVNLQRWNERDSSGRPQHHPIDDALERLYQHAMCASTEPRAENASESKAFGP